MLRRKNSCARILGGCLLLLSLAFNSQAATRLAVLEVESPTLAKTATLLEAELFKLPDVEALDRMNLDAVLRERKLRTAFAADAVAERAALGKLLQADLLIILRSQDKPKPHAELIAFETRYGLRLAQEAFQPTADPSKDALALLERLRETVARAKLPIKDIVALPRMVDRSLTTERAYVGEMAARLIEGELLRKPGLAVVELAEARAFAKELALGEKNAERLAAPLYLLGEYRYATNLDDRTASYQLVLSRGERELDRVEVPTTPAGELPTRLSADAQRLLTKALGTAGAQKPADAKATAAAIDAESRHLVERARTFFLLGDDETSLGLYEAALTIKPDQPLVHSQAHEVLIRLYRARRFQAQDARLEIKPEVEILLINMLEDGLPHAEAFLTGYKIPRAFLAGAPRIPEIHQLDFNMRMHPDVLQRAKDYDLRCQQMLGRVLNYKKDHRVHDHTLFVLWQRCVPYPHFYDDKFTAAWTAKYLTQSIESRLELIKHFTWLEVDPDAWVTFMDFNHLCVHLLRDTHPERVEEYRKYVDRFEELKIPGTALLVKRQREMLTKFLKDLDKKPEVDKPLTAEARPKAEVDIRRQELKLVVQEANGRLTPLSDAPNCWIKVADKCDLVTAGTRVFLMKKPGELRPIPLKLHALRPLNNSRHRDNMICGDGKYAWLIQPDEHGFLAVIDLETEKVWELTPSTGLPPIKAISHGTAICSIEPGVIGVAGSFNQRTWAGTAKIDPAAGIKLDVFYEAKEKLDLTSAESRNSLKTAFGVNQIAAIQGRAKPDGPLETRLFLPRMGFNSFLLLDPAQKTVELHTYPRGYEWITGTQDGAVFISAPDGQEHRDRVGRNNVYRIAFPELKMAPTKPSNIPWGKLYQIGERSILAYGRNEDGNKTATPWYVTRNFPADLKPLREELINELRDVRTFVSAHYGLVAVWEKQIYRMEWR